MFTVNLPFLGSGKGRIGLQKNRFELLKPGTQGNFLHHAARLPESIGANYEEGRLRSLPLDRLPPSRIRLVLRKIDMEPSHDFLLAHQGPETQAQSFPLLTRATT